jgi:hypothetical protein
LNDSTHVADEGSSFAYLVHAFFFASWVAVCSAAPELIWQGFHRVLHHFDGIAVGSALLVGAIVAFFVEPVTERLRAMSFKLTHKHVDDAITAYVAANYAGQEGEGTLVYAINEVFQWAWIPFVVTIAWLCARQKRWIALPILSLAFVAIVSLGFVFDWNANDIFTSTVPCVCVLIAGFYVMRKYNGQKAFSRCTIVTAVIALIWLVSMGFLQAILSLFTAKTPHIYSWSEYTIDFRFYIGWVIGLMVAPIPTKHHVLKMR